ncbi:MAG: glycoside hydrolase family 25 protein [Ferruginibacter sp.]|nr:glycoside hydrolase family 25 protein [Ferruginibacter sp.]
MAKKKKFSWGKRVARLLVILAILAAIAFFVSRVLFAPSFIHYRAFGISIPANYELHGIDVSRHQQTISWEDVQRMQVEDIRLKFAFIKATEGIGSVDEQFRRNWLYAQRAGMVRGAYHFFIATKSGKAQAKNFISTVQLKPGDLPPVLDVEQTYGASAKVVQKEMQEWLTLVENKWNVMPIIYTNVDFYNRILAGKFDQYPLWVAHYLVKDKPRIKRDWSFWQHNETGHVNGISSFVDFNVFNGDSLAFEEMRIRQ